MAEVMLTEEQRRRLGSIPREDPAWELALEVLGELGRDQVELALGPDYTAEQRAWECGYAHGLEAAKEVLEGLREQCT